MFIMQIPYTPALPSSSASIAAEVLCMLLDTLGAQLVNNLPSIQEIGVQSLGWKDPLEKRMAISSSILAWKIPWTEEAGGLQSMGTRGRGYTLKLEAVLKSVPSKNLC